jgi:hypothetical protein
MIQNNPPQEEASVQDLDEILQKQELHRFLTILKEGEVTFGPTYKVKPGIKEFVVTKDHVPSYSDRIFYLETDS